MPTCIHVYVHTCICEYVCMCISVCIHNNKNHGDRRPRIMARVGQSEGNGMDEYFIYAPRYSILCFPNPMLALSWMPVVRRVYIGIIRRISYFFSDAQNPIGKIPDAMSDRTDFEMISKTHQIA